MATTTKAKKPTAKVDLSKKIRQEYIKYRLEHGKEPASIYAFATQQLKMEEAEFYKYYNSFIGIESDVWLDLFKSTESKLMGDETYAGYGTQEKLLAFFFTMFEDMKIKRSFLILSFDNKSKGPIRPKYMDAFYEAYSEFMNNLINEGIESGEIATRPDKIQENYYRVFWGQFIFLIDFWIKDISKNFEDTDAAIEKSVNLLFELVGKNIVDNVFDFAKFLIQRR